MNEDDQNGSEEALDEESADSTVQFEVSISTDRDHFLRRTCPSCGRDFKTIVDQAELAWVLSEQVKRIGLEIGAVPADEEDQVETELNCPYCDHVGKTSEMHTEETIDYFKRFVYRECVVPMLNSSFSDLEDDIGTGHSGGGFISMSVSLKHEPITLPPRPIHGPDAADMKIVHFLCCDKQIKVRDSWNDITECIYCKSRVAVV
jgi:hypothetical protein